MTSTSDSQKTAAKKRFSQQELGCLAILVDAVLSIAWVIIAEMWGLSTKTTFIILTAFILLAIVGKPLWKLFWKTLSR